MGASYLASGNIAAELQLRTAAQAAAFRNTLTVAPDKYAVWVIFEARLVQNALLAAERQYIGVDTAPT